MAWKLTEIFADLTVKDSMFVAALARARAGAGELSGRLDNMARSARNLFLGLSIGGTGVLAAFTDLDATLARLQIRFGLTADQLADVQKAVFEIGTSTSATANAAALSLEEMAKSGMSAASGIALLAKAEQVADASGTSMVEASRAIARVLQAFGGTAEENAKLIELMTTTSIRTGASLEDLSILLARIGPLALESGTSLEDLMSAVLVLGRAGIESGMAVRTLRSILLELQNPSKAAASTMQKLGIEFVDAQGKLKPLGEILQLVAKATAGMSSSQRTATLETLFGANAVAQLNILLSKGGEAFGEYRKALDQSTMTSSKASDIIEGTFKEALENLYASMLSVVELVTLRLKPGFMAVVESITQVVRWFVQSGDATIELFGHMALLASGAVVAAGAVVILSLACRALFTPMNLMVYAVLGLASAFIYASLEGETLAEKLKSFREGLTTTITSIKDFSLAMIEKYSFGIAAVIVMFSHMKTFVVSRLMEIGLATIQFALDFYHLFTVRLPAAASIFNNTLGAVFSAVWDIAAIVVGRLWEIWKNLFLEKLPETVMWFGRNFMGILNTLLYNFLNILKNLLTAWPNFVREVLNYVTSGFKDPIDGLFDHLTKGMRNFVEESLNTTPLVADNVIGKIAARMGAASDQIRAGIEEGMQGWNSQRAVTDIEKNAMAAINEMNDDLATATMNEQQKLMAFVSKFKEKLREEENQANQNLEDKNPNKGGVAAPGAIEGVSNRKTEFIALAEFSRRIQEKAGEGESNDLVKRGVTAQENTQKLAEEQLEVTKRLTEYVKTGGILN